MIKTLLRPFMKKYWKVILSMTAVSSLGIALMVGLSGAYMTLEDSLNRYVSDYHYADIVITTRQTDDSFAEELNNIADVYQVDARLVADVPVRISGERLLSMRAVSYDSRDLNEFYTWETNESSKYPNIALDYKFADRNGIHAGDLIEVKFFGRYRTACVGSLVTTPECLGNIRDVYAWGENADFGFIFVPENLTLGTILHGQCNQFLIYTEAWADDEAVKAEAITYLEEAGLEIKSSWLFQDSPVELRIEMNTQPIKTLSLLVPGIFFVAMVIVIWLFLSQMICQSRRDIGILRALGFEKQQIEQVFCLITLLLSLTACLIGMGMGAVILLVMSNTFGDALTIPQLYYTFSIKHVLISAGVTVFGGQLAAWLSTRRISRILPTEAMTRELPPANRIPGYIQKRLSGCTPTLKLSITSILRNGKRFAFSTACLMATVILILSSLVYHISKDHILVQLYDMRLHYDVRIFMTKSPTQENIRQLSAVESVSQVEQAVYLETAVCAGEKSTDTVIVGLSPEGTLVDIYDEREKQIPLPENGIILDTHTARELGVTVGDEITVNGYTLPVTALSKQSVNRMEYVTENTLQHLGKPDRYSILCLASQEEEILRCVDEWDGYLYTDFTKVLRQGNEEALAPISRGMYVLIGFSVFMGFLIIYNTTQTNLHDWKKELSTLRALGFQIREISKIWAIQTLLQYFIACLLGIPLGTEIAKKVLTQMAIEGRDYPFVNTPVQYILTAVIVFIYIVISHFAAMRSIGRWNIAENIKEKE